MDATDHDFTVYPEYPGAKGSSETGHEAAAAMAPITGRLRKLVLTAVTSAGASGLTVLEMAARFDQDRMSIQPRFSELRALGKIVDSGMRRRNPNGKRAIVWTLPEYALPALTREAA